jgi:hypothetical protein
LAERAGVAALYNTVDRSTSSDAAFARTEPG